MNWFVSFAAAVSLVLAACATSTGELTVAGPPARPAESIADRIDPNFEKFVLENGLTLIVHEDRKAPIVAINVWYHVGSGNEKPGRTGFAHLFEHLMFQGTENLHGEFFDPLEKAGATGMNGTTNTDRTNYFETVPTSALDLALWLESDRMGHLLGAIDQARLDEQRGVVQNEKRQGENRPYGASREILSSATAPAGHPYSWSTIGSMEDLNSASLEDVHEWFKAYYGAANATLVVAGDVDAQDVKARVERYFGDIPSGPPIGRPAEWVAPMIGTRREVVQDRVAQPRLTMVWNVAPWGDPSLEPLDLFADVLAGSKTTRLHQRLIVKEKVATDAFARVNRRQLGSQFVVSVTANPGVDLREVERMVDEEIARLLRDGATGDELERARMGQLARFLRATERVGGFFGKSDLLAECEVFAGDPGFVRTRIERIERATRDGIADAALAALDTGRFILDVVPFPAHSVAKAGADRSRLPDAGTPPDATFPAFERTTLRNGLEVWLAERRGAPTVEIQLLVGAGSAADPRELPGLARMTLDLMDEGTKARDSIGIAAQLERIGARLSTAAGDDFSSISLSALSTHLDASLDLLADVALRPSFPAEEFARIRGESLVRLQGSKLEANAMAQRVLPRLVYGDGHPYGQLGGGSGTEESLAAMTPEALAGFHARWFKPGSSRLLAVGDVSLAELRAKLEERFGAWQGGAAVAAKPGPARSVAKPVVYLMDRPQAPQSVILAAIAAPPTGDPADLALDAMNDVLGGNFTSRINMNLREQKGWSYGARSRLADALGPRTWLATAPVQTNRTRESMVELAREIDEALASRPLTGEELATVKLNRTLSLSGRWETNSAVLGSLAEIAQYGLAADHWSTYASRVRALAADDLNAAAARLLDRDRFVWIVVGDRARIEPEVRAAAIGEVVVIDPDGNPIDVASS